MANLLLLAKFTFSVGLFVTWSILFLYPSLDRFLEAGVAVEEMPEDAILLPPPAVTFCGFEQMFQGWKNVSVPCFERTYEKRCGTANKSEDFVNCVEEKTFNLTDLIPFGAQQGVGMKLKAINEDTHPNLWSSDITSAMSGRCYTLNYTQALGVDLELDSLVFNLNPKMKYMIFVHHHDLFLLNSNPMTLPRIYFNLEKKDTGLTYHHRILRVFREERINRPKAPCNSQPAYKLASCVKEKISQIVNCTLPWHSTTTGNIMMVLL